MKRHWLNTGRTAIVSALMALALVGCGDGAGGTATPTVTKLKGQFIDSPVAGLSYETESGSGITDSGGYYEYLAGERVKFFLGKTELGSAIGNPIIHVFDLKRAADDPTTATGPRLAQLLQTLDEDGNPANGIQLSEQTRNYLAVRDTIDFKTTDLSFKAQLEEMAKNLGKVVKPLTDAVKHAQSNVPAEAGCLVPDRSPVVLYPALGAKYSSAGRTCHQKAEILAFTDYTLGQMQAYQRIFYDRMPTDESMQADVENFTKNNLVTNFIYVGLDAVKLANVSEDTNKRLFLSLASAGSKLFSDMDKINVSLCKADGSCTQDQEHKLKLASKLWNLASQTTGCMLGKPDKCASEIKAAFSLAGELGLEYGNIPPADLEKVADAVAAQVDVAVKIYKATTADPGKGMTSGFVSAGGAFIETGVKMATGFYTRSKTDSINRGGVINLMEIVAEGVNVAASCQIIASPDCLKGVTDFTNKRAAEIGVYGTGFATAYEMQVKANDVDTAIAILSEYFRYQAGGGVLKHYGISENDPERNWKLIIKVAETIGSPETWRYKSGLVGGVRDLLSIYWSVNDSKVGAVLRGWQTSCDAVKLGDDWGTQQVNAQNFITLNQPVTFSATYQTSAAIKGYLINFGDGEVVQSDVPAATHTFTRTGWRGITVTPVVRDVKSSNPNATSICNAQRKTVGYVVWDPAQRVSSVSPTTATAGATVNFSIIGANLPATTVMSIPGATCSNQKSSWHAPLQVGFSELTATCIMGPDTGDLTITVKSDTQANGGAVIDATRTVKVSAPVCTAPQVLVNGVCVAPVTISSCGRDVTNVVFSENFSTSLDPNKWVTSLNGGNVWSGGNKITLSSSGNTFPLVKAVNPSIPANGNFSFYCKAKYNYLGGSGNGACVISDLVPNGDGSTAFGIWGGSGQTIVSAGFSAKILTASTDAIYTNYVNDLATHEYEFCVVDSNVSIYRDGILVGSKPLPIRWKRPSKLWLGHMARTSPDWSSFETNKVEIRQIR